MGSFRAFGKESTNSGSILSSAMVCPSDKNRKQGTDHGSSVCPLFGAAIWMVDAGSAQ